MDRGPRILDTVRLVRNMVVRGSALCVPGNHDMKLMRKLRGKNVQITHGLADTLAEIDALPDEVREPFCKELAEFLDGLVSHYVLDDGKLVVAHAGMKAGDAGPGLGQGAGLRPLRRDDRRDRRVRPARPLQLGGGIPGPGDGRLRPHAGPRAGVAQPHGQHRHRLRLRRQAHRPALPGEGVRLGPRRPDLLRAGPAVPARRDSRLPTLTAQQAHDEVLDAEDVLGKRIVPTRLRGNVTIREENATAALEVMSRFAADPKWLIYLPPTMSPCETSGEPGLLEHPAEAFAYYRSQGAPQVVCEEKHMGSRAVVDRLPGRAGGEGAVRRHRRARLGIVYTRTGRRFFNDPDLERQFLDRVRSALTAADLWGELETTWVCLDCELMPWSAKAQELLQDPVRGGRGGGLGLAAPGGRRAGAGRGAAGRRGAGASSTQVEGEYRRREQDVGRFVAAYRQYCWPVDVADRPEAGPVPPAGHRGARPHGQGPHLAHGDAGRGLPGRPRTAAGDPVQGRGRDRPGEPGGRASPGGRS